MYYDYKNNAEGAKKSHTWARGKSSIAIGTRTIAYGDGSTAMGTLAIAGGNYSTAFGAGSIAFGDSSISIGNEAYVYASESVGVGNNVQAISEGSIVYGLKSYSGGIGSVAIGTNVMTNVKMSDGFEKIANEVYEGEGNIQTLGKLDHNLNFLEPVTEEQPGFEEKKAEAQNTGAVGIGYYAVAYGENSIALGRHVYSKGNKSIAIGPYAYSKGEKSAALGYGTKSLGADTLALGSYSRAEGENSVAIGIKSAVKDLYTKKKPYEDNNESKKDYKGKEAIAIGNESEASLNNSVALGYRSKTDYDVADLGEVYAPKDSLIAPSSSNTGVVSVGSKTQSRRIVNVAAGYLDTDAVNVSQLKALEQIVDFNSSSKNSTVPYYGMEQEIDNNGAAKISKGLTAEDDYIRYVEIAGQYAELLNRKHNGNENISETSLDKYKAEVERLANKNSKFAQQAKTITDIYKDLSKGKTRVKKDLNTTDTEIKNAVKDGKQDSKKRAVSSLTAKEITESNYRGNLATGKNSIAIGYKARAEKNDSIALGSNSIANRDNKQIGIDTVTGKDRANINKNDEQNYGAWKSKYGALSIGNVEQKGNTTTYNTRQITGVAAGSEDTDAVNVAQLKNATLHYVSVKNPTTQGKNYANDGAINEGAIAIGVGAEAKTITPSLLDTKPKQTPTKRL